MANGDCPVGAANKADIANHGREISEMKARMTRIEDRQDEHSITIKHQGWQIGLVIGLIVVFGGPLAQKLMALLPLP
jgi:hypothetical protein